jgi:hypothetical protein
MMARDYIDRLIPKSKIPEGQSGSWKVQKFTISKSASEMHKMQSLFAGHGSRGVEPGKYTRIGEEDGHRAVLWMSDTHAERKDHIEPVRNAKGHCLITGLGLGVVTVACLRKSEVDHVTVIEQSADAIKLVLPHIECSRLTVIEADAMEWRPPKGEKYGMVWHDIWPSICEDNLPQMGKLHRRFARRADWQGSWCRPFLQAQKRRNARAGRWY